MHARSLTTLALISAIASCNASSSSLEGPYGIRGAKVDSPLAWAVPVEGGIVLVDTGVTDEGVELKELIGDDRVVAVLLTHAHGDHMSGLHALAADLPVFVHIDDMAMLRGDRAPDAPAAKMLPSMTKLPTLPPQTATPVEDGVVLRLGGAEFEGIHMPGHTAGSMVWRFKDVLFTGDSVVALEMPGAAVGFFNEDDALAHDSIEKLRDVEFSVILDGHVGKTEDAKRKLFGPN